MKFFICIFLTIVFIACEKGNPVAVDNLDNSRYLGLPNTTREYESTTWMYEANSSIPYIKVPDSLYSKLSFDSVSIKNGVAKINKYQEVIIPKDTSYNKFKYYDPNTVYCQEKIITNEYKDLATELDCVQKGIPYNVSLGSYIDGTTFAENINGYFFQFNDSSKYYILKKPLYVGSEWIRDQWQYKADNGNYESIQILCKVISKEDITVKAGRYSAYKVEVTDFWVDLNYKILDEYEYYVPNIGLVLTESDMNLYSTTLTPGGPSTTIFFRQKVRLELISVNFINN